MSSSSSCRGRGTRRSSGRGRWCRSAKRDAGGAVVGARAVLLGPAAELRPDERQDAVGEPACLEVALEGGDRVGRQLEVVGEATPPGCRGCRSRRAPRSRRSGSAGRRRASPRAPPGSRRKAPSSSGRGRAARSARPRRASSWAQLHRLQRRVTGLHADRRPCACGVADARRRARTSGPRLAPDARRPEVVGGPVDRGHRHRARRQRGRERAVEREALERVVGRADRRREAGPSSRSRRWGRSSPTSQ